MKIQISNLKHLKNITRRIFKKDIVIAIIGLSFEIIFALFIYQKLNIFIDKANKANKTYIEKYEKALMSDNKITGIWCSEKNARIKTFILYNDGTGENIVTSLGAPNTNRTEINYIYFEKTGQLRMTSQRKTTLYTVNFVNENTLVLINEYKNNEEITYFRIGESK